MERRDGDIWANPDVEEIVVTVGGAHVTVGNLQTYAGTEVGNDEVLNAFLHLLNTGEYAASRRTHILKSHFNTKLKNEGYEAVRRWTRAADETRARPCIAELDRLIVPIHHTEGIKHWALMEVHSELTAMRCLDSCYRDKTDVVKTLAKYVMLERARSAGQPVPGTWEPALHIVQVPLQDLYKNACGPRTAVSAMYLMQQDAKKLDAAADTEVMSPQHEQSMIIFGELG